MMFRYLCVLGLALCLFGTARAQVDYDTIASEADLLDGGTLADVDIDCMDFSIDTGQFVFYNEPTGDLVAYDPDATPGSRTVLLRSNAQIDADRGADVIDCRAVAVADGFVYAGLSADNVDFVYKTDLGGATASILGDADGITGIDVLGATVYLALVEFFGAPEDGFYAIATTGTGQTPAAIATEPALDLYDLVALVAGAGGAGGGSPVLISSSSEFGGTGFQNVLVTVDQGDAVYGGGGSVVVILDPFADGTFTNGSDGGLEDVEFTLFVSGEAYMFNNSFGAPEGEQWGFTNDGVNLLRFAEETPMLADPDVTISGYDAPDGTHMAIVPGGTLYVASVSTFGGEDAILAMYDVPVPVELTAFTATADGPAVRLAWETASETNNAGFEVQLRQGDAWTALAFVEGHGTTTEAQTYSFTADGLQPGTYSFRLKQIDFDGAFEYLGEVEATIEVVGTHVLSAAYPNPFNPQATFAFTAAQDQRVTATLYNALGHRVATLFDGAVEANAQQQVMIDGARLASGLYVVRVEGERFSDALRVTLLK